MCGDVFGTVCVECATVRSSARIRDGRDLTGSTDAAVAFADQFPVSAGHTLIVPRRHVSRLEELEQTEWLDLFALVRRIALALTAVAGVDGVNVGFNSGAAAGQTCRARASARDPPTDG
jgi:histidine triad (HIT) family protein